MIRLEDVRKTYRQGDAVVRALDGVTLTVPKGQFVSVMGASGSGKSTMLHLMGGLDAPDGGTIEIDDRPLARLSDDELTVFRRRRIGFVFQFFHLLPALDAEENVALPLLLDGRTLRDVRPRVTAMLDRVGLGKRRTHRPDALSGGERQRVAVARALVIEPALVLADEPTGNLDSKTGEEILALIRETAAEYQRTVVMVTHDPRAAAIGDRVLTLADGRIVGDRATAGGEGG